MEMKKRIFSLFLAVVILFSSTGIAMAAGSSDSWLPGSNPFETIETIQKFIENRLVESIRRFIDFFAFDCDFIFSKRYISETGNEISALKDGFVPQGLCYVDKLDCFAVSGYTDDGSDSRIYLDNGEKQRTVILKGYTGHAGGIAS